MSTPTSAGLLLVVFTAATLTGCGDDDSSDGSMVGGGGDGGDGGGGAGGSGVGGGAAGGAGGNGPTLFTIHFDYRFDTKGLFDAPERRAALEGAAAVWEALIVEDFDDIPAGTQVLSRDPEAPDLDGQTFAYEEPIDDLVVFVGFAAFDGPSGQLAQSYPSAAIGSVSDPALSSALDARYHGADFEPWTAWLSFDESEDWFFDPTPLTGDDLPPSQTDFVSVAMHELGHILGFGTADAYFAFVDAQSQFTGPAAMAAFGGPIPLTGDGYHIAAGTVVDGGRPLMDPSDAAGERSVVTSAERGLFSDLGYAISP
jgi:hypothetical protein